MQKIIKAEKLDVKLFLDSNQTQPLPSKNGPHTVRTFIVFAFDQGGVMPDGRPIMSTRERTKKFDRLESLLNNGGDLVVDSDDFNFLSEFFAKEFVMPFRRVATPIFDAIDSAVPYEKPKEVA